MKFALIVLLILFTPQASALSITYSVEPEIVLPGGIAECKVTITSPKAVKIYYVSILGYGVEVDRSIFYVGSNVTFYTFSFTAKAEKVGIFYVDVNINLENESLMQTIPIVVYDNFPYVSVLSSAYENEINTVKFLLSTPVKLKNVKIKPLFDSLPKELVFSVVDNFVEFYLTFEVRKSLDFEISFYNGKSYHVIFRKVELPVLPSKGVFLNLNLSHQTFYFGEAVELFVEVTNLRNDRIYDLQVSLICKCDYDSEKTIVKLESKETRLFKFIFSQSDVGKGNLTVLVKFKDEFGKKHFVERSTDFYVLGEHQLVFSDVKASPGFISGEISNVGRSRAYNVFIEAICEERKEKFLGNIEPSDFQSFEFTLACNESLLKVSWNNEIGKKFEIYKKVEFLRKEVQPSISPIAIAGTVVAVAIIVLIVLRSFRK
ncbi:MAG: hypothetical protein NZ895_00600 [Archaeoglobaceae archaeon]|nr:hypothetical protein [Archaeoglobaceae archaeon]MCX8151918.1 hypothetical protein [Archaeoglobaceae archaeon]MDW8013307.1 hypothetical protein [Archaeoglobaceae archaeon]